MKPFGSPSQMDLSRGKVSRYSHALLGAMAWLLVRMSLDAVRGQRIDPPPRPDVPPVIGRTYPDDADDDRVDDALEARARQAAVTMAAAQTPAAAVDAQARLNEMVRVELVFSAPVTKEQIDHFLAMGGQIDYMYKAVSYGWNGQIPLRQAAAVPASMGAEFVQITEAKPIPLLLNTATRTARVRPIWAAGFAGNASGFDGDPSITIAIVGTGVDSTHPDLAGRQVYWRDFSDDGYASPIDLNQHGSHVAGIALGSGAASGSAPGTLYFTENADYTGLPLGDWSPRPVDIPGGGPVTYHSVAWWLGGGLSSLYVCYHTHAPYHAWIPCSTSSLTLPPAEKTDSFMASNDKSYSAYLLNMDLSMREYVIASSITDYPAPGDGFNRLRGVAPACGLAVAKYSEEGEDYGYVDCAAAAIDDLVAQRGPLNIKVMNLSFGGVLSNFLRQKVNNAVNNGIVVAVGAGNDGRKASPEEREIGDPGRAAMAITVAAANDVNALTNYSSEGFPSPAAIAGIEEDFKPDVIAPGGSSYYSLILSVDSNHCDGPAFADQQPNDYCSKLGTSMATPFVAGCAALVIDAMQQKGVVWDHTSSQHARYVKMVLSATATETNAAREIGGNDPILQRAAAGPDGFPPGKDRYEGYGLINPDAAVEAVSLTLAAGATANDTLGPAATDRRGWARTVSWTAGSVFTAALTVPPDADFDLYLYSAAPSPYGTPVLLAASTDPGIGAAEEISYSTISDASALLVVKRVSGAGTFALSIGDGTLPTVLNVTSTASDGTYHLGASVLARSR